MAGLLPGLPPGYYLVGDPDTPTLRRLDGSLVAAFSAHGVEPEEIQRTAETDGNPESSACVRVFFFGRFEVFCGGERMPLGRNAKVAAILKYLLAHRDRPVSRDYLMEWLWPESNPKRARGSLNTAIHSLRTILDCYPLPRGFRSHVLLEEGHYRWCPGIPVCADADEFNARCARGRSLEERGMQEAAVTEYEGAVELYRGEYLPEDLYEEWTMIERQRLANSYLEVLDRLTGYYADTKQYAKCIRACYKILEKEPYYENGHRLLMYSNARLGLYTIALHQYRLYERMLRNKFDVEPSARVQALYRDILTGGEEGSRANSL